MHSRADRARASDEHCVERVARDLVAECAAVERLDAYVVAGPLHGVARRANEIGAVDGVSNADLIEQLRATRRERLGERRLSRRTPNRHDRMSPRREQTRRGGARWSGADDRDVDDRIVHAHEHF